MMTMKGFTFSRRQMLLTSDVLKRERLDVLIERYCSNIIHTVGRFETNSTEFITFSLEFDNPSTYRSNLHLCTRRR